MARVSRWAEKQFSAKCSLGDAVATGPDEDVSGWDFLVEFPNRFVGRASEETPARRQAFVQIKSTTGPPMRAKVKLSNMLRACGSEDAWFIFLVKKDGSTFGVEISDELMASALKSIRKARLDSRPLHQQFMSVVFSPENRVPGDVVEWMETRLGPTAPDYAAKKRNHFQTAGYENGAGSGKITLSARNHEELSFNLLGLGDGLKVQRFLYSDKRFGIPEPPQQLGGEGMIVFKPEPIDTCEIRLRCTNGDRPLIMPGTVYGFNPPMAAPVEQSLRFSAPPLEVIVTTKGGRGFLKIDEEVRHPFERHLVHAKLMDWFDSGPITMEIRRRGTLAYSSTFHADAEDQQKTFQELIAAIARIGDHTDLSAFRFSVSDLKSSLPTAHQAALLLSNRNLRLEDRNEALAVGKLDAVLYLARAQIAELTLAAIVERPVTENVVIDGLRRITMGAPSLLEAYAIDHASETERAGLDAELTKLGNQVGLHREVLVLPGIMDHLFENRNGQKQLSS